VVEWLNHRFSARALEPIDFQVLDWTTSGRRNDVPDAEWNGDPGSRIDSERADLHYLPLRADEAEGADRALPLNSARLSL